MTRIPFILLSTSDGSPITGAAPTVTISKDGAAFTAATNTPAEIGNGYYYINLTDAETTVTYNVVIRATATGAQPTAVVWEPEQAIPNVPTAADNAQAVWGATTRTVTNTIPSTSDISGAVWGANARTLTASPTDISGLATSTALGAVADNVTAIKAKTDNLPQSPAAVGSAMTLTQAYDAAKTASQFDPANTAVTIDSASVAAVQTGLSTFNPATDAVTINSVQAATMVTADVSGLATATAQAAQTAAINKLDSSVLHWAATANTLTLYGSNNATLAEYTLTRDGGGNITAIAPKE